MRFKVGDRVIQNINGKWITATVLEYKDPVTVYCKWDDDHLPAPTDEDGLILLEIYSSPLYQALK